MAVCPLSVWRLLAEHACHAVIIALPSEFSTNKHRINIQVQFFIVPKIYFKKKWFRCIQVDAKQSGPVNTTCNAKFDTATESVNCE